MEASPNVALWVAVLALPLVLALATAFTKVSVVLGALRMGFSAEALLPLPVIFALSILVTAIVMAPTATAMVDLGVAAGGLEALGTDISAWRPIAAPLADFVAQHADAGELSFFGELMQRPTDDPLVLVSGFVVTELAEAFAIAVVLLVPLVVVDLLVAQGLVLMGLVQQPTPLVTVPIKILLFLAVGGWDRVLGGLVEGYR
ncbi:MAG: hypothetical protein AAF721_40365 [Myxococcota bacterium]